MDLDLAVGDFLNFNFSLPVTHTYLSIVGHHNQACRPYLKRKAGSRVVYLVIAILSFPPSNTKVVIGSYIE